jgi:hypothetical protein
MRQLLFGSRNYSSKALCCPEHSLSVLRHTRSSTWTLRSNILRRSRGSNPVVAQSGYTDDRFRACHIEDRIL